MHVGHCFFSNFLTLHVLIERASQERFRSKWRQTPRTSLKRGKSFLKLLKNATKPNLSQNVAKKFRNLANSIAQKSK